jgi:hypothetical protein
MESSEHVWVHKIAIMPLIKGLNFKSDNVDILIGFDGTESKALKQWSQQYKDLFPSRFAIALNKHYPELRSGAYLNRYLVALIQETFAEKGLHIVVEDNYQPEGIVPEELAGGLEIGDDYLLVDESLKIHGHLNVWESPGGKGKFYHDQFILEVVTTEATGAELIRCIEEKCRALSVTCAKTQ